MHTVDNLLSEMHEMNLDYYEIVSEINEDEAIQLVEFEQLCTFLKKHKIDTVFYRFEYMDAEDLQITDQVLNDLNVDDEIIEVMQKTFEKYNNAIMGLDFSRPYYLTVNCLYQGRTIYIEESDYWFEECGYGHPKKMAVSMIKEKLNDIASKKEAASVRRRELREQLRERILTDPSFHKCTNKEFRREYTRKLWDEGKHIQGLFYSEKHGRYDISIDTFVEDIWREYKAGL